MKCLDDELYGHPTRVIFKMCIWSFAVYSLAIVSDYVLLSETLLK